MLPYVLIQKSLLFEKLQNPYKNQQSRNLYEIEYQNFNPTPKLEIPTLVKIPHTLGSTENKKRVEVGITPIMFYKERLGPLVKFSKKIRNILVFFKKK